MCILEPGWLGRLVTRIRLRRNLRLWAADTAGTVAWMSRELAWR